MKNRLLFFTTLVLLTSCFTVRLISGYDEVLDQTINEMKKEFNLHFIKLQRTIMDDDPNNQKFENFQDYYDNLEANLITIKDRTKFLDGKSQIVKTQVIKLDSAMHVFVNLHKAGFKDSKIDDRHDLRNGVNSTLDAVTLLQESLKTSGKTPN